MDAVWTVLIQFFMCGWATFLMTRAVLLNQSCNFDNLCGWTTSKEGNFQWQHCTVGTKECLTGIEQSSLNGGFMYVKETSPGSNDPVAKLSSPTIMSLNVMCVFFRYYISHPNTVLNLQTDNSTVVWSTTNLTSSQWQEDHINIHKQLSKLVFEVSKSKLTGYVAVDYVHISDKECIESNNISCNFENDNCNWTSSNSSLSWSLMAGSFVEPHISDHTTNTDDFEETYGFCPVLLKSTTKASNTTYCSISSPTPRYTTDSFSSTTVGFKTDVPDSAAKSSSGPNGTGIIVGVVIGIAFIVGLSTFLLWWFVRRSKSVRKNSASHENQMLSNEYTGHQSVALPALPNQISNNDGYTEIQTKGDKYQHINSHLNTSNNTSGRKYAKLDHSKNLADNKAGHSLHANGATNHDYIYLDETETGSTQTSMHVTCVNMLKEDIHKSNEYAVIDPNSDHSSGMAKDITHSAPSLGNYAILDPNATGFFRSKGNKEPTTDYEFAVPINDNECVNDLHDPYTVSEDGAYDSMNMERHKEAESNIYSHAVENAYDMSSHERKIVYKEGTYDHFLGDETEDNYNISKRE